LMWSLRRARIDSMPVRPPSAPSLQTGDLHELAGPNLGLGVEAELLLRPKPVTFWSNLEHQTQASMRRHLGAGRSKPSSRRQALPAAISRCPAWCVNLDSPGTVDGDQPHDRK
jgi:hypothetical protein